MLVTLRIKRFINSLKKDEVFTSRDLVKFGSRAAVDQVVYRLVKSGVITRIIRGVFMRTEFAMRTPSVEELARIKAESFARNITTHAGVVAKKMGLLLEENDDERLVFAIDSHSTSFRVGDKVVHFRFVCPRKRVLAGKQPGDLIRALWHRKEDNCKREVVAKAICAMMPYERSLLPTYSALMPSWLNDQIGNLRKWPVPLSIFAKEPSTDFSPIGHWFGPMKDTS